MFQMDQGRPPGEIRPLENQVPDQGDVGPRAMLPLVPAREQQNHDVLQHADLGHEQHDDIDMNLHDMLPFQQLFNLGQHDDMLEDGNAQPRGHRVCTFRMDRQDESRSLDSTHDENRIPSRHPARMILLTIPSIHFPYGEDVTVRFFISLFLSFLVVLTC